MANKLNAVDSAALAKAIRMCLESGQVELGSRMALSSAKLGKGKLIVMASNTPAEPASDLRQYCSQSNIPLLEFGGTSMELGSVCGKPFPVSMIVVNEVGNSPIMDYAPKQ